MSYSDSIDWRRGVYGGEVLPGGQTARDKGASRAPIAKEMPAAGPSRTGARSTGSAVPVSAFLPLWTREDALVTDDCRFWLDWIVNALIAAGTIGAVLAALFGERLKAHLFRPRLKLSIPSLEGVATPVSLTDPLTQTTRTEKSRYYHVEVRNLARWPTATQVQICVIHLEEKRADGEFEVAWSGEVPLRWMLHQIHPLARDVGRPAMCDLCCVVKGKWVELLPMIQPLNFNSRRRKEDSPDSRDFVATLQGRSAEGSSLPIRVRISWDGEWEDGGVEMQRHLKINVLEAL